MKRIGSMVAMLLLSLNFSTAKAQDIGLTPSDVTGLWMNINEVLLATATFVDGSGELAIAMSDLEPSQFYGKVPADVYAQVDEFHIEVDLVLEHFGLDHSDLAHSSSHEPPGEVSPSDVYLNSGLVLYSLVALVAREGNDDQLLSQFYQRRQISNGVPSDAYAQVDMAHRRIDLILAHLGDRTGTP